VVFLLQTSTNFSIVSNVAARLILQLSFTPFAPYLMDWFQWLPISTRIDYKIAILTYILLSARGVDGICWSGQSGTVKNGGVENAGVDNSAPCGRGGQCGSGVQ